MYFVLMNDSMIFRPVREKQDGEDYNNLSEKTAS